MTNILNLNQSPERIAEEAKLMFYPLIKTPYPSNYPKLATDLAIMLIENMEKISYDLSDQRKLSSTLEILKKKIKS